MANRGFSATVIATGTSSCNGYTQANRGVAVAANGLTGVRPVNGQPRTRILVWKGSEHEFVSQTHVQQRHDRLGVGS